MNPLNALAQQQLAAHIVAWAGIPVSLTLQSPITYVNGGGLNVSERLAAFTAEVRAHEAALLHPLGVSQPHLDSFLNRSDQYRLLFWQLPLPWIKADKFVAGCVLRDMEALGISLRALEQAVGHLGGASRGEPHEDQAPLTVGREINYLRRFLASRASFAEEILGLVRSDPAEALQVYYDESLRRLRRLEPLVHSLELYHSRRPSYRPLAES
jgi:hypothetical protein